MLSDYNIYKSEMDDCNDKGQQKVKKYSEKLVLHMEQNNFI